MKIEAPIQRPVCKGRGVGYCSLGLNILRQRGVEERRCLVSCYTKCEDNGGNMRKY